MNLNLHMNLDRAGRPEGLVDLLEYLDLLDEPRIVVAGGPLTGKTTLAKALHERRRVGDVDGRLLHTDDLVGRMAWSESSLHVARLFDETAAPWVVEGVTAVRALRKWCRELHLGARAHGARPCDLVLYLGEPVAAYDKPGQETMAKGCWTVWREVRQLLLAMAEQQRDEGVNVPRPFLLEEPAVHLF
jgi:hypothetical protein